MSSLPNVKIGDVFGRWTVIKEAPRRHGVRRWHCRCSCDDKTEKDVVEYTLRAGTSQSCGCLRKEEVRSRMTKHGCEQTRLYHIWKAMKWRCSCDTEPTFHTYKGKGIAVCDEWHDFTTFAQWALANGYDDSLTIDRIDVNLGYCPGNCRWATYKEQANNKSINREFSYMGEIHTVSEWSEILNMQYTTLMQRLNRGWSIERVVTQPVSKSGK
jgi:hypothetical protein